MSDPVKIAMKFILATLLLFAVLYQVAIGGIVTRSWKPGLRRQDDPGAFWFLIVLQTVVSAAFIAMLFFFVK